MAHQIVAVQGDVEGPGGHADPGDALQLVRQPARERGPRGADADQREIAEGAVAVGHLVGDSGNRARDLIGRHHHRHGTSAARDAAQPGTEWNRDPPPPGIDPLRRCGIGVAPESSGILALPPAPRNRARPPRGGRIPRAARNGV